MIFVCRRVRESRQELRKYMREVKKNCPSSVCNLQYDKLYVNHRCYVWSDVQARVVQYSPVSLGRGRGILHWTTALCNVM